MLHGVLVRASPQKPEIDRTTLSTKPRRFRHRAKPSTVSDEYAIGAITQRAVRATQLGLFARMRFGSAPSGAPFSHGLASGSRVYLVNAL